MINWMENEDLAPKREGQEVTGSPLPGLGRAIITQSIPPHLQDQTRINGHVLL